MHQKRSISLVSTQFHHFHFHPLARLNCYPHLISCHSSHAEAISPVCHDHVTLQTLPKCLHLSFVFQMKVVVCSLVLPYIGKLCDSQKVQMIDNKYFICEICGKVFTPASNLRKHIATTVHQKFQFKRHKMVHTNIKLFLFFKCVFV